MILVSVFNMDMGPVDVQLNNLKKMKEAGLPVIGVWHWNQMEFDDFQRM